MEACFILALASIIMTAWGVDKKRISMVLMSMLVTVFAMLAAAWSNSITQSSYYDLTITALGALLMAQLGIAMAATVFTIRQRSE